MRDWMRLNRLRMYLNAWNQERGPAGYEELDGMEQTYDESEQKRGTVVKKLSGSKSRKLPGTIQGDNYYLSNSLNSSFHYLRDYHICSIQNLISHTCW